MTWRGWGISPAGSGGGWRPATGDGRVAGQLLSGRGWSTHDRYDAYQATRPVNAGLTAALGCELPSYFGGDVAVGGVADDGQALRLSYERPGRHPPG
ncbi:hypothetical protein OOK41_10455 [Micromonospora sp. NBC_01655]|uniref:hypothetical protein n=1 Tax=Micromonospora sp. NBC_01655 TaxID=2975983 RepID=UPI00224D8067|nr:hypothetical protein [Micromonospora sp. NBC_01655]MCX4470721.1 hypothetical protein [Micromonospora sp. NBC_01655]